MQRLVLAAGVAHAVGRDERQAESRGKIDQRLVALLLLAPAVALQFDVHAPGEEMGEPLEHGPGRVRAAAVAGQRLGERSLVAAGEQVQAGGELLDLLPARRRGAFRLPPSRGGEQLAEIPVAGGRFDEQREAARGKIGEDDLGSDQRAQAGGARRFVEPGCAGDPVAVDQGDRRQAELGGARHEILR